MADTLGRLIRHLRKEAGWSRRQLAESIGVSASTIARIENGQVIPSAERVVEIVAILGHKEVALALYRSFVDPLPYSEGEFPAGEGSDPDLSE